MSDSPRKSITESPLYWIYVFCTAGLIGLTLLGPKIIERQFQEERRFEARERAFDQQVGRQLPEELATRERTLLALWPFYAVLVLGLVAAWVVLWWRHFRVSKESNRESEGAVRE